MLKTAKTQRWDHSLEVFFENKNSDVLASKLNGTVALTECGCSSVCFCVYVCVYPYGSTPEEKQIVRTQKYI